MSKSPKRTPDRRPTLTLKSADVTPEFRSTLNKAAKRRGMTQAAFAIEVLHREARRVLSSNPIDNPMDTPPTPAVLERVEETDKRVLELAVMMRDASEAQQEQMADLQRQMAELHQRSFWQRLRGR